MAWKVRFRGKDYSLTHVAASDGDQVQQELMGQTEEPGSYAIEFQLDPEDDKRIIDIIIKHSVSDEEYPYRAIHGHHDHYGEVYMMSGPENGILIYDGQPASIPSNEEPYTGDGI